MTAEDHSPIVIMEELLVGNIINFGTHKKSYKARNNPYSEKCQWTRKYEQKIVWDWKHRTYS